MPNTLTATAQPVPMNELQALLPILERASTDPRVDVDKLERLLSLHERVVDRQARMAFYAAQSSMQEDMPVIEENGAIRARDGSIQSRYARFEDINEMIKPVLRKHAFALSFRTGWEKGEVIVTGVLSHAAGHHEVSTIHLPADASGNKNSVQSWGSSISYGKRYTTNALLNITSRDAEPDNDGQGSKPPERAPLEQPRSRGATNCITDRQVRLMRARLDAKDLSAELVCERFGVDSIVHLPFDRMNDALDFIEGCPRGTVPAAQSRDVDAD